MNSNRKNRLTYALLALVTVVGLAGCQSPKKMAKAMDQMKLKADPEVLEVHGDSILVNIKGKIPPHAFAKNAVVKFQPVLRYGAEEKPLKPMYLKGDKAKQDGGKTISYSKGGPFTYTDKIEYTPEMKKSNLTMDYTIKFNYKYNELEQCKSGSKDSAVKGTITTSLTVKPTDDLYYYANETPLGSGRTIIFYYVINEGKLRDSVMKGPTITKLRNLASEKDFKFSAVVLNSYASPDGEMALNQNLVQMRANSAYALVKKELAKLGVQDIKDSNLVKRPDTNGEDWEGLKRLVSMSNMDGKDDILGVINSNMTLDEKEASLRKLPSWNALKTDILPKLRRTEVTFSGTFPNRKIEEVRTIGGTSLDNLTQKELIMLANNSEDTAMKSKVYQYYMNKYPDDWAGGNNYAVLLIKEGQYEAANRILEDLHAKYRDNDTIHNNLGVAKRFLRKYDDAKNLYNMAQQGGLKENNNLGILYIKYGDYQNSVNSFEADRCDYNVALAYTLKGDYDQALKKIDCIEDKTASVYYLRAIVGARKGDKDLMTTSLTRAVQMDPTMRDMAKEDLEFRNYNNTAEFKNALGQ